MNIEGFSREQVARLTSPVSEQNEITVVELDEIMKTDMYRAAYSHCNDMIRKVVYKYDDVEILDIVGDMLSIDIDEQNKPYLNKSLFLIAFRNALNDVRNDGWFIVDVSS